MVFVACMIVISVAFIAPLGRTVVADLESLSRAESDDISWNVAQVEIELLRMQNAAYAAMSDPQSDFSSFRQRYDIFYSRMSTLSQSAFYRSLEDDSRAQDLFTSARAFLTTVTPVVDGPDDRLRTRLPLIQTQIDMLRPMLRQLALIGLEHSVNQASARRDKLTSTLIRLAVASLSLVLVLGVGFVILQKLLRAREHILNENQIMRSRFEAMVSSSLNAVLVVDIHGKIIEFNGSAEAIFGYSRDEVIGEEMAGLIVPEHLRDMHHLGMQRFLDTGEKKVIGAGRVRLEAMRKSGEIFPVELSISLAEAGGVRVFVSYLRDITQELKAEDELRNARDKAQAGEKAKSELLTVMSHEMRTPLNGILGSLELIDQTAMDARQKRHLNSIAVSGELLLSHVNDVLDLSSLTAGNALPEQALFDLEGVVQNVVDSLLASAAQNDNSLQINFLTPNLHTVQGHKSALQQCLVNLVGNAIKFTKNGTVTIEVEKLSQEDVFEIRVSDNGAGISPENLPRVFEEFVTLDATYTRENTGTGLGLAITRRLVEAMGGEISVDSVLGEGSMFTVRLTLPSASPIGNLQRPQQNNSPAVNADGLRALIVDDNEINRLILVDILQDMKFDVAEAADGYEAIRQVAAGYFDVVFLDISMPGIDGIETLNRLRQLDVTWRDLPAIGVTAHVSPSDHDVILKADFSDLLLKPVDVPRLRKRLAMVLGLKSDTVPPADIDDQVHDFKRRFGPVKYDQSVLELKQGVTKLLRDFDQSPLLTPEIKQCAHKLAGSAAILGETELHHVLQEIEACKNTEGLIECFNTLRTQNTTVDKADHGT